LCASSHNNALHSDIIILQRNIANQKSYRIYLIGVVINNALGRAPTIYQNRTPSIGQDGI